MADTDAVAEAAAIVIGRMDDEELSGDVGMAVAGGEAGADGGETTGALAGCEVAWVGAMPPPPPESWPAAGIAGLDGDEFTAATVIWF